MKRTDAKFDTEQAEEKSGRFVGGLSPLPFLQRHLHFHEGQGADNAKHHHDQQLIFQEQMPAVEKAAGGGQRLKQGNEIINRKYNYIPFRKLPLRLNSSFFL